MRVRGGDITLRSQTKNISPEVSLLEKDEPPSRRRTSSKSKFCCVANADHESIIRKSDRYLGKGRKRRHNSKLKHLIHDVVVSALTTVLE